MRTNATLKTIEDRKKIKRDGVVILNVTLLVIYCNFFPFQTKKKKEFLYLLSILLKNEE